MSTSLPSPIRFGREVCGDLGQAERREWWLANGRGGFAAGTVAGTLTRRYHGLLIATVHPPLGRRLIVAKADTTLSDGVRSWPLFTNRWGSGMVAPRGHLLLESFRLDGRIPTWTYACDEVRIEHRIWMEYGADTTYAAWRCCGRNPACSLRLAVTLLVNARDFHGSTRPGDFDMAIEGHGAELRVVHPDWFALTVRAVGGAIAARHDWYEDFDLPVERERGLPDRDSNLCVGEADIELRETWCGVVMSLLPEPSMDLEEALCRAQARDRGALRRVHVRVPELTEAPDWVSRLVLAADSFVIARPLADMPGGESVIAGYPWFGDWGRDTMIALPGLALATGRFETARRVLETFARFVDRGMLPNVFPGAGEHPEYNTVDAALWYVEAWRAYVDTTADVDALAQVYPVLASIIAWHVEGTRYGIGVDPADDLLRAGESGVQLTWMDAKVGDWVVTPRIGKPVEINALWYNALAAMAAFSARVDQDGTRYRELAQRVREGFQRFVCPDGSGLYDVIDGPERVDSTVRPNQILAVSLPASPVDAAVQRSVVDICARLLATSYGLRSLDPRHRDYRAHYSGGVRERDSGYHQGPVWAWLLGPYALASYRVTGDAVAAQALLAPMRDHLADAALGSVSEIFDGAPPHTPRGAPCQAWSVACTLEAWWRLERARTAHAIARPSKKPVVM